VKEHPILFSGPMIRAILAGTKTQTRRIVRVPERLSPVPADAWLPWCPYGTAGDHLWCRETCALVPASAYRCSREEDGSPVPHRVSPDGTEWAIYREGWSRSAPYRWRPSIHMPRWASRITLEVRSVRVERLQDISEADARAEGVESRDAFRALWQSLHGGLDGDPWVLGDPWVWVVEFRRVQP
jgi:hypothetical protein